MNHTGEERPEAATHRTFLEYTIAKMDDPGRVERFRSLKDKCEQQMSLSEGSRDLSVLDVGCGMGVQARLWARDGHRVTGFDLDLELLAAGRERADAESAPISWVRATAGQIPFADGSFDVCLAVELLEHVPHWYECLQEMSRVLRPGGLLLVTTSNAISPRQSEFRLPLYSWWPGFLKRRMVALAKTTRPELANHTPWPAVNWFTFFGLRRALKRLSMAGRDRFDMMDLKTKPLPVRWFVRLARFLPPVRAFLYLFLPGTVVFARKSTDA